MRAPRSYQLQQFDSVRAAFKEGKRHVIVESPTGTGKTVSFVLMSKMVVAKKKRVLILVNRNVLVEQTLAELRENDLFAAREQAEERASLTAEVVVGSIQSLDGKWLARWPKDHFGLVILDECHGSGAASFKRILDHFQDAYHCGFTATPERHDKKGLWKGYSDIVFSMSLKEAIDDGWLCGFEFVDLECPVTLDLKLAKHATFSESEEVFDSAKYLPRLADCAMAESAGRKGLFFLPNCRVSNQFADMLKARGMKAEHIDSSYMPAARTEELLKWFKGEKEAILCNSDLLSVGFNQPDIDLVGLFRPIASTPMYKQRLGRGTRPVARIDDYATAEERKAAISASAKPFCKVLNVFWENGSHDLASPSCLITDDEEERKALDKERKAGKKVDLAELENQLKAKRMENEAEEMRKFAEKVANSQEKKRRTEVYVADILKSPKYGNPASEKQYRFLYVLSKRDFRNEKLTSKQASRIIGRYQPQAAV